MKTFRTITLLGTIFLCGHLMALDTDAQALYKLINSVKKGTVEVPPGNYYVDELTIPETISLKINNGTAINVRNKLEINGGLEAGLYKVFEGQGNVIGKIKAEKVYPQWFGAKGDGKTDDADAIQKAADLAWHSAGRLLVIPAGKYLFGKDIKFRCNINCLGTFIKEIEVDESKTKPDKAITYCNSYYPKSNAKLFFLCDEEPVKLDTSAFYGIRENDFKVPVFENVSVVDGTAKISLKEGGTLYFSSSDFTGSRNNNHGDQFYCKKEICQLVSTQGDVFPEFMFSYQDVKKTKKIEEWNKEKVYKKGDYCRLGEKIYKATWPSGKGTVYENKYKGIIDIGSVSPQIEKDGTRLDFKYKDGVADMIQIWQTVWLNLEYSEPQIPITVNGLSVEIYLKNSDDKTKRLFEAGTVIVERSNMTFDRMSIACKNRYATLPSLLITQKCVNVTYNNCHFSGATNHGLGYNIENDRCANITYNNCISTNCRDAMAGNSCKNITVNGGFYNKIDDHYGRNYIIRNVEMNAMSTYIPGYRTPQSDETKWGFKPDVAFAFDGGNILIENCRIYNCSSVFNARGDMADMSGTVSLRNIDIISPLSDVALYVHSITKNFDYAHKIRIPKVIIENIRVNSASALGIHVRGFEDYSYGPIYIRNCENIKKVIMSGSGTASFVDSEFNNCTFEQGPSQIYKFSNCSFTGKITGITEKNIGIASGNMKTKDAVIPFPLNYFNQTQ